MSEDKDFYKDIIDNLYDGVYFVDRERVITYWNKGAERITGYKRGQVLGISCANNVLNHVTAEGLNLCKEGCPLAACMLDGQPREADVFLHHADGHRVPVLVRAAPLHDAEGNITGAVETFSSDAGLKSIRHELKELRRTVQVDMLTGVGNRRYFKRRLRGVLAELDQQADLAAALLFIDIDDFKGCNDSYGHALGDKVLKMLAATLRHNLRETDAIARWGGDEFVAILYDVTSAEEVRSVAEKLRILTIASRLDVEDASLSITISVGATLFQPMDTPDSVTRRADALMYEAKQSGGNAVQLG